MLSSNRQAVGEWQGERVQPPTAAPRVAAWQGGIRVDRHTATPAQTGVHMQASWALLYPLCYNDLQPASWQCPYP